MDFATTGVFAFVDSTPRRLVDEDEQSELEERSRSRTRPPPPPPPPHQQAAAVYAYIEKREKKVSSAEEPWHLSDSFKVRLWLSNVKCCTRLATICVQSNPPTHPSICFVLFSVSSTHTPPPSPFLLLLLACTLLGLCIVNCSISQPLGKKERNAVRHTYKRD